MLKKMTLALASIVLATTVQSAEITGAGATFPYPVYSKWASEYKLATGNQVNYQSIGSGAGIKQIQAKTVTFGASDMPLDQKDLDKDGLIQFPTVIGGNVIAVNIDGVKPGELVLDGELIADIYLGKVKKWNDARIQKYNPTLKLPNANIVVVRRSDGSGTTYIFSKYLNRVSKEWSEKVGEGTALEWPVGVGAKGNDGVASNISQTKNSIGYVEYAFAKQNNLSYTGIFIDGRGDQKVVLPNKQSFQDNSWPIAAPTYIIMYKQPQDKVAAAEALKFFKWAYENGSKMADDLDYIPMGQAEINKIMKEIWSMIKL